jgi:hypothetical protein
MDIPYVNLPYEFNLDPKQICKLAFEEDDIDLAKKIKNYSISIRLNTIVKLLKKYKKTGVYNYVLNNKIKQYNPTDLILRTYCLFYKESEKKLFKRIFNLVKNDPKMDYKSIYKRFGYNPTMIYMLEVIKEDYGEKNYKKFCLENDIGVQ